MYDYFFFGHIEEQFITFESAQSAFTKVVNYESKNRYSAMERIGRYQENKGMFRAPKVGTAVQLLKDQMKRYMLLV